MANRTGNTPTLVITIFVAQVIVNWLYNLWVAALPIVINSWFVMLPLLGFFYFTFAFISAIGMYKRTKIGLMLAYGVLMFGATTNIISYNVIYKQNAMMENMIVPMMVLNFCVICYMAVNNSYFKGD